MSISVERVTVSSTLNKNTKEFGKSHLFDGNPETCWNSDSGSPQWIQVKLKAPSLITSLQIQFHGGFCGLDCSLEAWNEMSANASPEECLSFYPKDNNLMQNFPVHLSKPYANYRLVFHSSTDFFGRVTVYHLGFGNCSVN